MQVVGQVNAIHENTKPQRLEAGQVVKYQFFIGSKNPDAESAKRRPLIYPSIYSMSTKDRIWDNNLKKHVDIGVVESYSLSENGSSSIVFKHIVLKAIDEGELKLTGGNFEDEEMYEILELMNTNENNPNRNRAVAPQFKRIDVIKDSKERSKRRSALKDALTYAMNLTDGQVKDMAASFNWNENEPIGVLRDRIEDFAQKDPEQFINQADSKDVEVKTIIKKALTAGVISYNTEQHKFVMPSNNQTLIKLDRVEGVDFLTLAAEYVLHNKNGQKVFDTIKKLLQPANVTV